jgi:hypothetical protein
MKKKEVKYCGRKSMQKFFGLKYKKKVGYFSGYLA